MVRNLWIGIGSGLFGGGVVGIGLYFGVIRQLEEEKNNIRKYTNFVYAISSVMSKDNHWEDVFDEIDTDKDTKISFSEITKLLEKEEVNFNPDEITPLKN